MVLNEFISFLDTISQTFRSIEVLKTYWLEYKWTNTVLLLDNCLFKFKKFKDLNESFLGSGLSSSFFCFKVNSLTVKVCFTGIWAYRISLSLCINVTRVLWQSLHVWTVIILFLYNRSSVLREMDSPEKQALHNLRQDLQSHMVITDRILRHLLQQNKINKSEKHDLSVSIMLSFNAMICDGCRFMILLFSFYKWVLNLQML